VLNILLQVLEDGMITDAYGTTVDFKNTIVIMTSNIGSTHIARTSGKMGFHTDDSEQKFKDRKELVLGEVKRTLSPEFINRIDEIIVFDALSEVELAQIARIMIRRLNEGLADREIELQVSDEVCQWLVEQTCEDRSYGARPLRRGIQRHIEDALSEALIGGELARGGRIKVRLDGDKLAFSPVEEEAASTQPG